LSVQEVHRGLVDIHIAISDRQRLAVRAEGEPRRATTAAQRLLGGNQPEAAVIEPDFSIGR